MLSDVCVVIRSSGERTEQLCRHLTQEVIQNDYIFTINEAPFSRAVQHTFEIGIKQGLRWTLAIDADILIDPIAITSFIESAGSFDNSTFFFNPHIIDKFFCSKRLGGPHLYRTALLPYALQTIKDESFSGRPETTVVKEMEKLSYSNAIIPLTVGLHDYEQYYRDIFRKAITHSIKHSFYMRFLNHLWRKRAETDPDYKVALWAYEASHLFPVKAGLDSRKFVDNIDQLLDFLGLSEKSSTPIPKSGDEVNIEMMKYLQDKNLRDITNKIESLKQHQRNHPRFWLMRAGGAFEKIGRSIKELAIKI